MCKLLVSTRVPAVVCLALGAFVLSAAGDDSPPSKPAKAVPKAAALFGGDQALMKVLDEPTAMDFVETPLRDVVQAISTRHNNIPIQLDTKSITDAGGSGDTPITFQLSGISLRSALRLMLREHELDFVLSDNVLLITSAEKPTTLRQYDVTDLLTGGMSIDELGEAVRFALPRQSEENATSGGGPTPAALDPSAPTGIGRPGSPGRPGFARGARPVVSSGPAADGEVMSFQSVLLVRATDRGHANVETFLAELRHHMINHGAAEKSSGDTPK